MSARSKNQNSNRNADCPLTIQRNFGRKTQVPTAPINRSFVPCPCTSKKRPLSADDSGRKVSKKQRDRSDECSCYSEPSCIPEESPCPSSDRRPCCQRDSTSSSSERQPCCQRDSPCPSSEGQPCSQRESPCPSIKVRPCSQSDSTSPSSEVRPCSQSDSSSPSFEVRPCSQSDSTSPSSTVCPCCRRESPCPPTGGCSCCQGAWTCPPSEGCSFCQVGSFDDCPCICSLGSSEVNQYDKKSRGRCSYCQCCCYCCNCGQPNARCPPHKVNMKRSSLFSVSWILKSRISFFFTALFYTFTCFTTMWFLKKSLKDIKDSYCPDPCLLKRPCSQSGLYEDEDYPSPCMKPGTICIHQFETPKLETRSKTGSEEEMQGEQAWVVFGVLTLQVLAIIPLFIIGVLVLYFMVTGLYNDIHRLVDKIFCGGHRFSADLVDPFNSTGILPDLI